jgi:hypothetical protein
MLPMCTRPPSGTRASRTITPLTQVPLRLPRSRTHTPSSRTSKAACRRDTSGDRTTRSQFSAEPTTWRPRSRALCDPRASSQDNCGSRSITVREKPKSPKCTRVLSASSMRPVGTVPQLYRPRGGP